MKIKRSNINFPVQGLVGDNFGATEKLIPYFTGPEVQRFTYKDVNVVVVIGDQ